MILLIMKCLMIKSINILSLYHLQYINQFMKTQLQMSLRNKKPSNSLPLNIQNTSEQYIKNISPKLQNYNPKNNSFYAKILVKFINQLNQNCRQHNKVQSKQKNSISNQINQQKIQVGEIKKKVKIQKMNITHNVDSKQTDYTNSDKNKLNSELQQPSILVKKQSRIKDQIKKNELKTILPLPKNSNIISDKNNTITTKSNKTVMPSNYLPPSIMQYFLFFSMNKGYSNFSKYIIKISNLNNQNECSNKIRTNDCQEERKIKNQSGNQLQQQPKKQQKIIKCFRKPAFHVAIANYIHQKKIKQGKNEYDQSKMDPTYFARKLRQQTQKFQQCMINEKSSK